MFDNIVAKEGHEKILVAFIAFIILVLLECTFLAALSFATFALLIYIYRYKYIDISSLDDEKIYAPISGKVIAIDTKNFKKSIYIDVNLCDSHILRSLENNHISANIHRGLNLFLSSFKSKKLNERASIEYKNSKVEIFSSMCNDTISLSLENSSKKGEKMGTFLHGQVIVTLNENISSKVSIGDKLTSGITVLGEINTNS